jgi:hypothetical protein
MIETLVSTTQNKTKHAIINIKSAYQIITSCDFSIPYCMTEATFNDAQK